MFLLSLGFLACTILQYLLICLKTLRDYNKLKGNVHSISPSLCLFLFLCVSLSLSLCLSVCLCGSLSLSVFLSLSLLLFLTYFASQHIQQSKPDYENLSVTFPIYSSVIWLILERYLRDKDNSVLSLYETCIFKGFQYLRKKIAPLYHILGLSTVF